MATPTIEMRSDAPHEDSERCDCCTEQRSTSDLAVLSCGHFHCTDCLQEAVYLAEDSTDSFPARCCDKPIEVEILENTITDRALIERYKERLLRFNLPQVYCSAPICSAFILPENVRGDKATCPECSAVSCIKCQQILPAGHHEGLTCEFNLATKEALAVMKLNGYRSCPKCKTATELISGCNDTHCTFCGEDWCHRCGRSFQDLGEDHCCNTGGENEEREFVELPALLPGETREELIGKILGMN